jgi:hypothetical protein
VESKVPFYYWILGPSNISTSCLFLKVATCKYESEDEGRKEVSHTNEREISLA